MGVTVASLLRVNGHPGHYVRIAGHWRLEEVRHPLTPQTTPPLPSPTAQAASGELSFLP